MYLTRISDSCEFVKFDPTAVTTVIVMVIDLLFSLGSVGRRCMENFPLSTTT